MPDIVSLQTIAGVQHRITPESWDTRLTLLSRRSATSHPSPTASPTTSSQPCLTTFALPMKELPDGLPNCAA